MTKITGAFVWPKNNRVYLFSGKQYIRLAASGQATDAGYPAAIAGGWHGMPDDAIDAAVVWPNSKVYFFKDDKYYRYDIAKDAVDPGYPQKISDSWRGVFPSGINGGFVKPGGKVAYFFRGSEYVRFNLVTNQVDPGYPLPIKGNWGNWPQSWESGVDSVMLSNDGNVCFFKGSQIMAYSLATDKVLPGFPQINRVIADAFHLDLPSVAIKGFLPSTNGFHFSNRFPPRPDIVKNVPPLGQIGIGIASNGLCGGMSYSVRDFFEAGLKIPPDLTPPLNGPLFDYIASRLFDSFDAPAGPAKYLLWMNIPDHDTLLGPAGRAHRTILDELPLVLNDIDYGRLSPLSFVCVNSLNPGDMGKNHQVLAYGYRWNGPVVSLQIYDCDHDGADDITLTFDTSNPKHTTAFRYATNSVPKLRDVLGFFRSNYTRKMPPQLNPVDGRIILFNNFEFRGSMVMVQGASANLASLEGGFMDNRICSAVVLDGNWSFFRDAEFQRPVLKEGTTSPVVLRPGMYHDIEKLGIKFNQGSSLSENITSLKAVTDAANLP